MTLGTFLATPSPMILVEITATRGSAPREAGTIMLVASDAIWGTIGGGNLEFAAIDRARAMLAKGTETASLNSTLGPDSGQCCGGQVDLSLRRLDPAARARLLERQASSEQAHPDIFIFGAGHVGRALAVALAPLPFRVTVVETREDELALLPATIASRLVAMPESLVAAIRPGGAAVILTHDHGLDFLIAEQALARADLAYVGMIGSKTKRAVFSSWLARQGSNRPSIDRLVLPIGGRLRDKRPEVIAALTAAELLLRLQPQE